MVKSNFISKDYMPLFSHSYIFLPEAMVFYDHLISKGKSPQTFLPVLGDNIYICFMMITTQHLLNTFLLIISNYYRN